MEQWSGKIAIVTGASSGIGAAIAKDLVKHGVHVVGLARRVHRLEELAIELSDAPGKFYAKKCDVSKEQDIKSVFSWIKNILGAPHILINNAGVLNETQLHNFNTEEWLTMMNVNVLGFTLCTREALNTMKEQGVDDGHIININRRGFPLLLHGVRCDHPVSISHLLSPPHPFKVMVLHKHTAYITLVLRGFAKGSFLGHTMSNSTGLNMYAATKHAVTTLTEALRRELVEMKSQMRISSLSPGIVRTELLSAGVTRTLGPEIYDAVTCLEARDVSDAMLYILGTPSHVQIQELTILPIGQLS